jgi:sec-independent protein translocase protein TatB
MDNIGFSELVLLGIIALVVLGPEKLPGAIRSASLWIGRLKRSFNTIKTDIEREIGADEIRRQLRNEAIMDKFKQTKAQVNDAVNTVKKQTDEFRRSVELEAKAIESAANPLGTVKKPADEGMTGQSPLAGAPAQPAPAALPPSAPAEASSVAAPRPEPAAQPDSGKTS